MSLNKDQESSSARKRASTSHDDVGNADDSSSTQYLHTRQDEKERRQIRLGYRNLIENLNRDQLELINPESNALNDRLDEAEELYEPVKMTREAALDSYAIALIANLGRQKAQALHTELVKFQPGEFAEKLITFLSEQDFQEEDSPVAKVSKKGWENLGNYVQPFFKHTPPFRFMYGSFERGEIEIRAPVKKVKEKDSSQGKATVPKQVTSTDDTEKSEATTAEVERVLSLLQQYYQASGNNPICFFAFVTSPISFGQTVENIFHTSFLIKDGHAKMFEDDDGLPVIAPVVTGSGEVNANPGKRQQAIISITPGDWKEIVATFHITEPMIPSHSRHYHGAPLRETQNNDNTSRR